MDFHAVYQRCHDPAIQFVNVRALLKLLCLCRNIDRGIFHLHKHIVLFRNNMIEVCLLNIIILREILEHTVRHVSHAEFPK